LLLRILILNTYRRFTVYDTNNPFAQISLCKKNLYGVRRGAEYPYDLNHIFQSRQDIEDENAKKQRYDFLRKIGYKQ
jgi:hypothetical protein